MGMTFDINKVEFKACASCADKTATLCPSCLWNRQVIEILKRRFNKRVEKSSIIKMLMGEGYLKSDLEQEHIKPNHGSCCCCQTCGHYHDECVCENNDLLKLIEDM